MLQILFFINFETTILLYWFAVFKIFWFVVITVFNVSYYLQLFSNLDSLYLFFLSEFCDVYFQSMTNKSEESGYPCLCPILRELLTILLHYVLYWLWVSCKWLLQFWYMFFIYIFWDFLNHEYMIVKAITALIHMMIIFVFYLFI